MQVVRIGEMNVLQTGANVAVTQLKSNNCDEGQLDFFFFFPPLLLCAGDWAEFQSLLFSHSDSVGRREKKKSVLLPHSHRKFIILFSVCGLKDSRSERLLSPVFSTLSLPACHGHHLQPFLAIRSLAHKHSHMRSRCLTFPRD